MHAKSSLLARTGLNTCLGRLLTDGPRLTTWEHVQDVCMVCLQYGFDVKVTRYILDIVQLREVRIGSEADEGQVGKVLNEEQCPQAPAA
jgi:hypothetical protein